MLPGADRGAGGEPASGGPYATSDPAPDAPSGASAFLLGTLRQLAFAALAALAIAIAFGIGIASARRMSEGPSPFGRIAVGPWTANPSLGLAEADPYTRAALARSGALPLGQAEGIVFTARADSNGAPLRGECSYAMRGRMPLARHWSLVPVPRLDATDRPTALHSEGLVRDGDGSFTIALSTGVRPGNWLALPPAGPFELVASLYDTPVTREPDLGSVSMPAIERLACRGPVPARVS